MLHIKIGFESSWTNSFADENGEALFLSGSKFNEGLRGQAPVPLSLNAPDNQRRVHNIRQLNAANPDMTYRVPASYDNTVKGVLARLMGEVERLKNLPEDHPVHEAFSRTRYTLDISAEHDEVVSLATRQLNEIATSGAGVLPVGNPLYEHSELAAALFGHLGGTLAEVIAGKYPEVPWTPATPFDLISRLQDFKAAQADLVKARKAEEGDAYVSPFAEQAEKIQAELAALAASADLKPNPDEWNWAGAVVARVIHTLPAEMRAELVAKKVLSRNGGLPGLAMSGGLGNVTPKDIYEGSGCQKAYSNRMPYSAELWFGDADSKQKLTLGVIKKTGTVHLEIDLPDDAARALKQRIEDAAVGPFHFGKKGIAYIRQMYVRSAPVNSI